MEIGEPICGTCLAADRSPTAGSWAVSGGGSAAAARSESVWGVRRKAPSTSRLGCSISRSAPSGVSCAIIARHHSLPALLEVTHPRPVLRRQSITELTPAGVGMGSGSGRVLGGGGQLARRTRSFYER